MYSPQQAQGFPEIRRVYGRCFMQRLTSETFAQQLTAIPVY
jgi:hypothetical protein